MKTRNKKYGFKRFLVGGMLALSVFSTSFLVSNFENNKFSSPVYANYQEVQTTISNNDFSSYSTSTNPYTPNNWTFNNPLNNESIKYGVIDVYDTVFPDKMDDYELTDNPNFPAGDPTLGSSDPLYKHLMINSFAGFGRAGYTSSSFTLDANSYYSISVTLRTNDQAQASIYLSGLSDEDVNAEITNISTFNSWATYTLYVETNEFTSENATLELWLGSKEQNDTHKGAVFFNKVTLTKYSETTFNKNVENADKNRSKVISLFNPTYVDLINNSNFNEKPAEGESNAITGWTTLESSHNENQMLKVISTSNYNAEIDTEKGIANPGTNFKTEDSDILFMYNKENGKQAIKSNEFVVKQNELYMISVWAKSDCAVGNGATIMVEEVNENEDEDEEFTANTASLTTATSITTNSATNGWSQYKIFVEGHPLKDTKATLQIWLGTKDSETSGYVFIDDISVQQISYATYTNGSASGTNATYTFNANNTQFVVTNGNFNVAQKTENTLTYPLTTSNWTLTSEDENNTVENDLCGTINTKTSEFEKLTTYAANNNLGLTIKNPGLTPVQQINDATLDNSSNNVLMIGNKNVTSQNYKSDTFSLTASSYYKISVLVNTQFVKPVNAQENTGAQIKLENSTFTTLNITDINTNGEWQRIDLYVYTGTNFTDFTLTLGLNNIQGFAFFDDVYAFTSTEEEYNANKGTNEFKVNLNVESNDSFDLHDNSSSALTTIYNWEATNHTEIDSVTYGALDTSKDVSIVFAGINNPGATTGNSVLAIYSNVDTHFTLKASQPIDLSVDSYYKITVRVRTMNISQEENKYDEDGNLIDFGATISLDGFDKSFTAINTEKDDIDGYATYTFYIKPTEDSQTYVTLGLGGEDNLASGYVFFDDVVVTTMEEAAYNEGILDQSKRTLVLSEKAPEDSAETEPEEFTGNEFNWYIVPSILLSLAIIIAIIGTSVRKFKITKTPKIKTKYDRRKTVEVDLNKRERIELRNEIIKELNAEYGEIENEIKKLVDEFDLEKAKYEKLQQEKLKAYEEIKQAIIIEREKATREYNDKLNSEENLTEQQKAKFEKEFKAYITKLDKRAADEAKKYGKKDNALEVIKAKHTQKVKVLTERQKYIQEEIARIEREIEEIAKQEEIMWNEYRRAKEEAKKQKLEYLAQKRKEKEEQKAKKHSAEKNNSKTESTEINNDNTNSLNNDDVNNVEIVEPDLDNKDSKNSDNE